MDTAKQLQLSEQWADFLDKSTSTDEFTDFRDIGRGSFGSVVLARRKADNKEVVLKKVDLSQLEAKLREDAINEIKVLSMLRHEYIIRYECGFLEGSMLNIVMEYADGGTLQALIRDNASSKTYFDEAVVVDWFVQIAYALGFVHENKVIHRDLKTANIFLTQDRKRIRLGDFGWASRDRLRVCVALQAGTLCSL
eukprot:Opistho-1_new@53107